MIRGNSKLCFTNEEKVKIDKHFANKNLTSSVKSVQLRLSLPNLNNTSLGYFSDFDFIKNRKDPTSSSDTKELIEKVKLIRVIVKAETKIVKFTSVILMIFFISWCPYACVALIGQFSSNTKKYITPKTAFIPFIFAKVSSTLNPLFFILTNSRCLHYFKNLILKKSFKQKDKKEIILRRVVACNRMRNHNTF
jgi:hypothetical protein